VLICLIHHDTSADTVCRVADNYINLVNGLLQVPSLLLIV